MDRMTAEPRLRPDELEMARILSDPGKYLRRRDWPSPYSGRELEELYVWQARAVLSQLDRFERPDA